MAQAGSSASAPFDLAPPMRIALLGAGGTLFAFSAYAAARAVFGFAPATPDSRDLALIVHLATVIPAVPLGLYVLLARKGGARHKLLGKIWLSLMGATAIATFFLRNLESGRLSWIHICSALTLVEIPKAILTARQGRIAQHKSHLLGTYIAALLVAGALSFFPGRRMWVWAFG